LIDQRQVLPEVTRVGGVAGILGVGLFIAGILIQGNVPMLDDSPATALAWFQQNDTKYLTGDLIIGLGVVLGLLPFFACMYAYLSDAEGSRAAWSRLGLIGALIWVVLGAMSSMFFGALAVVAGDIKNEEIVRLVQGAQFYGFGGMNVVLVLFFAGSSLAIFRTGAAWAGAAWLGLLGAILSLLSAAAPLAGQSSVFDVCGMASTLILGVFVVLVSYRMATLGGTYT